MVVETVLALGLLVAAAAWWRVRAEKVALAAELRLLGQEKAAGDVAVARAEAERASAIAQLDTLRGELEATGEELRRVAESLSHAAAEKSALETKLATEEKNWAEKYQMIEASQREAQRKLSETFEALSGEALRRNNEDFLKLAATRLNEDKKESQRDLQARQEAIAQLIKPLETQLNKMDGNVRAIEKARGQAYGDLKQHLSELKSAQSQLNTETTKLSQALKAPNVRGRWGEIQLRRVVEMAGMIQHCDFTEQAHVEGERGRLKPDMVVHLPNQQTVVVDSKAPLSAYLDAIEAGSEQERAAKLKAHASAVRQHMKTLSSKDYQSQFEHSPEFVVMFLPGEMFFSAALEQDPSLIEEGVTHSVILATPTTLVALLRAVAFGWRQEQVQKNAIEISKVGRELYERLGKMASHLAKVKKGLDSAVGSYNDAVGSFEGRVLSSARKFQDLGAAGSQDLPALEPIERTTREFRAKTRELAGGEQTPLLLD